MTYTKQRYRRDIKRVTIDTQILRATVFVVSVARPSKLYSFNGGVWPGEEASLIHEHTSVVELCLIIDNKYYVTGIRNSQTSQCQNVLRDVTELIQCVFR